jgi:hypothetical protein
MASIKKTAMGAEARDRAVGLFIWFEAKPV